MIKRGLLGVALLLLLAASAQARSLSGEFLPTIPPTTLTVVNRTGITPVTLRRVERAVQAQALQVAAYWHTPPIRFGSGGWKISLVRLADLPAGYAGDHAQLSDSIPEARVAVQRGELETVGASYKPAWTVDFSHEVLEMLADPAGDLHEICDPVEERAYLINGVAVSAFVRPAWFAGHRHALIDSAQGLNK